MTKPRDPSSFEDAAMVVARDFGPAEAAKIVQRGEKTIRNWTDPDKDGRPTVHQALDLDVVHLRQFGNAPFLTAYVAQLKERAPDSEHQRMVGELLAEALDIPVEAGRLLDLVRQAVSVDSPGGKKLSAAERAALQKKLKHVRDELDDVEAAIKKS
jgi:hypothetical protein